MHFSTVYAVLLPTEPSQLALLTGGVLVCLLALAYGLVQLRTAYRMYTMETRAIASVANHPGTVEIEGLVRSENTSLQAPFSTHECVLYEYKIERLRRDDDGSDWETVDSGDERVPFRLEDDTGSVLIDPTDAALRLDAQRVFRARPNEDPPSGIASLLSGVSQLEIGGISINTHEDRRYTERRLDLDEHVYVLGPARHDPSASEASNEVNAVIGRTGEQGLLGRVSGGSPFLLADGSERAALSRVVLRALGVWALGVVVFVVVGVVLTG